MGVRWKWSGLIIPAPIQLAYNLKRERIDYWVSKGAQLSDRVGKLLTKSAPAAASVA